MEVKRDGQIRRRRRSSLFAGKDGSKRRRRRSSLHADISRGLSISESNRSGLVVGEGVGQGSAQVPFYQDQGLDSLSESRSHADMDVYGNAQAGNTDWMQGVL